jgi:riboflavin synthase
MFTGIVSELGEVAAADTTQTGRRLRIVAPATTSGLAAGDSVAVNGVCLTAVVAAGGEFDVDVVQESLDRSNLGSLEPGDLVDLERPVAASGRFDGHIVQGHVDGVGRISDVATEGGARRVRIGVPDALAPLVVEKGSIAVDGVSLTLTAVSALADGGPWCEVVLIPHTLDHTVLGSRGPGDLVNLEIDVIAKYVARLLEARR